MENRLIKAMAIYAIVIMILISSLTIVIIGEIKNNNKLLNLLGEEMEENCLLWDYIDNIDTYKSIDDATKGRDDLKYSLQFIDE